MWRQVTRATCESSFRTAGGWATLDDCPERPRRVYAVSSFTPVHTQWKMCLLPDLIFPTIHASNRQFFSSLFVACVTCMYVCARQTSCTWNIYAKLQSKEIQFHSVNVCCEQRSNLDLLPLLGHPRASAHNSCFIISYISERDHNSALSFYHAPAIFHSTLYFDISFQLLKEPDKFCQTFYFNNTLRRNNKYRNDCQRSRKLLKKSFSILHV